MRGFWAIYRRELLSLWATPLAWVLAFVFVMLQGTSFYLLVDHYTKFADSSLDHGPVQGYFASWFVPISALLICPALSMRLFAEERRSGSIEALLTAPVAPLSVVLGKYLATWTTYAAMWLPTLLYITILRETGVVDWPVVLSSYLGVLLLGAGYLGVGTLCSALSRSQLVAMLLTTLVLFGWFLLGIGERVFDPGPLLELCRYVSVFSQLEDFSRGIIDTRRLVYGASVVVFSLFMCNRVVASWRLE